MTRRIYLDHNATTPLRPEALDAMMPYLTERHGNASSLHADGREAREAVEAARETVAEVIGAQPPEIIFTSGGTESNNHALRGVLTEHRAHRSGLVTSAVEHHAVLETALALARERFNLRIVGVDGTGRIDLDALADEVSDQTALVSLMHANNETGTIQPIEEAARIARKRGALFHTDAVQTVGKLRVRVEATGIDLLSMSAHKFGGPKGVGALYARRNIKLERLHHGGMHERSRRGGTENVPGIVGMVTALRLAHTEMATESERLQALTAYFLEQARKELDGFKVNSPEERGAGTINLSFERVDGESLVLGLDLAGISVSTGSACASGSMEPSHVLEAMGVPKELARGTVRFSFGHGNTREDADATVDALKRLLERSRRERTE
ncbi:MAG: cysteine desulfurase family protein [Candidatus Poribacteria bacterium]|nr:cysteine desulfurase family protein [Candidatus Poribacteria bacterium]